MDPSGLFNSLTGLAAVVMIFGVPVIAMVGATVLILVISQKKHRERMKMIEQGILPAPPAHRTGNFHALIITGAIMLGFGLALLIAELTSGGGDTASGLIFGFVGLAMVLVYAYLRSVRRKESPPPEPPAQS